MPDLPSPADPPAGLALSNGSQHPSWDDLLDRAEDLTRAARSRATRKAYRTAWEDFCAWCAAYQRQALPADPVTVAVYLADRSKTHAIATLQLRLVAIRMVHRHAEVGFWSHHPSIRDVWAGIRRQKPEKTREAAPILPEHLARMVVRLQPTLIGRRDRALVLLGFGAALRRSELARLRVDQLVVDRRGLVVKLEGTKTERADPDQVVAVPARRDSLLCPVTAVQDWLGAAGIVDGALFRTVTPSGVVLARGMCDRTVARIVQRLARAAGLDLENVSGHSLRAGLATAAALAGADLPRIKAQTRHRAIDSVLRYIRLADLWRDNVTDRVL